jgi:hypothetical protein
MVENRQPVPGPFRPGDQAAGQAEAVAVQAPLPLFQPSGAGGVGIKGAQAVVLPGRSIQRNNTRDAPQPIGSEHGRDLGVEEDGVQPGAAGISIYPVRHDIYPICSTHRLSY